MLHLADFSNKKTELNAITINHQHFDESSRQMKRTDIIEVLRQFKEENQKKK